MTVQRKKLIDDTGSAVVAECVSQLNRAAGYVVLADIDAATDGTEITSIVFGEDVYVTNISIGLDGDGDLDHANDDIFVLTGDIKPDGSGTATTVISAEGFGTTALTNNEFYEISTVVDSSTAGSGTLPVRVNAGDVLTVKFVIAAGSNFHGAGAAVVGITVSYRPVKDELTLQPNVPNKLKSWSSTAR
ncbi:MAG: hypothetical protein CMF11_06630 [Idiomarina sp.]|nr:hypothetical protein [Idiomarina sp.]